MKFLRFILLLIITLSQSYFLSSSKAGDSGKTFLRIMPLGGSNTNGQIVYKNGNNPSLGFHRGGYRTRLHKRIENEMGVFANFVGIRDSRFFDDPTMVDHNHEGYGGFTVNMVADLALPVLPKNGRLKFSLD